jgi:hypothetical protein
MNNKNILLAALFAACTPTWADEPADTAAEPKVEKHVNVQQYRTGEGDKTFVSVNGAPMQVLEGGSMGNLMHLDALTMHGNMPLLHSRAKLVKNAPYSAEVISERVQNLPDGNQIVNKTSTMNYRDSAGRTRQEIRDAKGEVKRITIVDTAENTTYVLSPKDKKATKMVIKVDREAGRVAAEKARERVEQLRKEGKLPAAGEHGDGNVIVKRIERTDGSGNPHRTMEDVQVRVAQSVSAGLNVELARVAPLVATAFNDVKWAQKPATKDMGTKDFDGVKAEGKMRSYEIPAGEVGNKNPITVSNESWFSPDLQITVYSKQSDPRSGDRIYRLAGLKRDEPAAALFTVPSDYTVKEMNTHTRTVVERVEKK